MRIDQFEETHFDVQRHNGDLRRHHERRQQNHKQHLAATKPQAGKRIGGGGAGNELAQCHQDGDV